MKKLKITFIALFGFACLTLHADSPFDPSKGNWVDLTHDFSTDTIYWPTDDGFIHTANFRGITPKGYFYASYNYQASEHGGTHIDSPIHFAKDRRTVDEIPIDQLIGSAVVIDVKDKAAADPDYQVAVDDFERWEREHGPLPDGAIVLLNTGYHRHWPNRKAYLGTEEKGPEAVAKLHFPGLHPDAARWLTEERRIKAIGLDTASIDYGQSTHYESHQILFKNEIPAFENVANLDALPPTGSLVMALPMKIKNGSGGPLRIVAWVAK